MNRTRGTLVFATSVLAAALGYFTGSRSAAPSRETLVAPRSATAKEVAQASAPIASTSDSDASETFAARYPDLARRAEANDRDAAKTLARDLARCMRLPALEQAAIFARMYATHGASVSTDAAALDRSRERVVTLTRDLDSTRRLCEGVSRDQVRSRAHWLYRAAIAGDSESAFDYGSGAFLYDDLLGQLEEIPFWRDHAEEMLERALAGGEERALMVLARGYDPERGDKAGELALGSYATNAYAYYTALSLLPGWQQSAAEEAIARLDPTLTEAERDEALAKAADICVNDLPAACALPPSASR